MKGNVVAWDCQPMAEDEYMEWECPQCGWDSTQGDYDDPRQFMGVKDYHNVSNWQLPFHAHDWIEEWKCPECGNEFEVDNSDY